MAKKLILETNIKRDKNKLYFCGTLNGNLAIYETEMVRGRKKKKNKEEEEVK